jgi:hypothetical protein
MVDPLGAAITLLRSDAAVAAIAGVKVRGEVLTGEAPPLVVIVENATTRRPFGPGSGRIGMALSTLVARCYGPDATGGAITARQLAGAVSDAFHGLPPTTVGTKYLARGYAPEIGGLERDPITKWPFHPVTVDIYHATEAVA